MSTNSIFQFTGYKIKKSLIEINDDSDVELEISLDLNGEVNRKKSTFELTINVDITNVSKTVKVNVTALGSFTFPKEKTLEELSGYFYMNAPALLFPYLRAYVATLTNLSGVDPINLPTLNLTEYGKKLQEQTVLN